MTPRVIATGLVFPEGPVELEDRRIAVVDGDGVSAVASDGGVSRIATCGGDPNGLARDHTGGILVANNGLVGRPGKVPGSIQRIDGSTVTELVGGLDAPNDLVVDGDGGVWFTDPRDSWFAPELRPGRVFHYDGALTLVHEGLQYPNGIGFDHEGRLLVAESKTGWLHHLVDGEAVPWVRCPTGAPDGFCRDAAGHVFVCCFDVGAVYRFAPDGTCVERHDTGPDTWPTNCTIGTDGVLYLTESKQGRLLALDLCLEVA